MPALNEHVNVYASNESDKRRFVMISCYGRNLGRNKLASVRDERDEDAN